MLGSWTGRGFGALVAVAVAFAASSTITVAEAKSRASRSGAHAVASTHAHKFHHSGRYARRGSLRHWASVLQCVPFARENSGIELTGNAGTWWDSAEGLYERGAKPEVGSILNFRSSGRMRMGHVAVVTNVIDSRHIEIDHANWSSPGRISRDIDVVDVSPSNDWTAVRVAIGQSEEDFGSTYPTYGFIYDRPDTGVMVANSGVVPGAPVARAIELTPPVEVAEAADDTAPRTYSHRHRGSRHRAVAHAHPRGHAPGRTSVQRVISRTASAPVHHRRRF